MINLKFQDLSQEAQEGLLELSRKDVEYRFGESIQKYADETGGDYEQLIEAEMIQNLYSYDYAFKI